MNIVFDLDGTLIDSAPDIQSVATAVLEPLGRPGLTLAETRNFIGEGSAVFVRKMMAARDIAETPGRFAALHQEFIEQYDSAVDKAVFYPGVLDVLTSLKAAGLRTRALHQQAGTTGAGSASPHGIGVDFRCFYRGWYAGQPQAGTRHAIAHD